MLILWIGALAAVGAVAQRIAWVFLKWEWRRGDKGCGNRDKVNIGIKLVRER